MSNTFQSVLTSNRRGYLLQVLAEAGGSVNDTILRDACRAGFQPHGVTRDVIRDDIEQLRKHGCVTVDWIDGSVALPKLTERGADVAAGHLVIDGITLPDG